MVAARRNIDTDWSEFESYATNHYARSLLTNVSTTSTNTMNSSRQVEQTNGSDSNNSNVQIGSNSDVKSINDEISSLRKALIDLRTQSEEVSRIEIEIL